MAESLRLKHSEYTVGWICPMEIEQVAAMQMLDEKNERLAQPDTDPNYYMLGSINKHNVVMAGLPTTGNSAAATVVAHMRTTFPKLRFGLLVGIGGGVPTRTDKGLIKLGDVVVSKPTGQHSGALQYDHGKAEVDRFERTGALAPPPPALLNAAQQVDIAWRGAREDPLKQHLQRIDVSAPGLRCYKSPGTSQDRLFQPDYTHADRELSCRKCGCDTSELVDRASCNSDDDEDNTCLSGRNEQWVTIHRGTIASGELVMRNGMQRDLLAKAYKVLCFEMEAAGALNDFPCLVIRGISDYADSHKNDRWQGYAAAVAAAYARDLFTYLPIDQGIETTVRSRPSGQQYQATSSSQLSGRTTDQQQEIAVQMVETGDGQSKPQMEDPFPSDLTKSEKNMLLTMRATGYWTWAQEHSYIEKFRHSKAEQARYAAALQRGRLANGL